MNFKCRFRAKSINQNTRNYTVKEKMDFGNPKKLRILTICVLFQVLKRLEEEEGGGAYLCRLCDTPSEAKVPS